MIVLPLISIVIGIGYLVALIFGCYVVITTCMSGKLWVAYAAGSSLAVIALSMLWASYSFGYKIIFAGVLDAGTGIALCIAPGIAFLFGVLVKKSFDPMHNTIGVMLPLVVAEAARFVRGYVVYGGVTNIWFFNAVSGQFVTFLFSCALCIGSGLLGHSISNKRNVLK